MGFIFNDIHSNTYGVIETVNCPIKPEAKTLTYSPQWHDGAIDYSDMTGRMFYEDRIFEFKLKIKANNLQALYTKASWVASWLRGRGELILDGRPNLVFDATAIQSIDFVPTIFGQYAELAISFRVKPFAHKKISSIYNGSLISNQEVSLTILNEGDIETATEIKLSGGTSGIITITNTRTNANFELTDILNDVIINSSTQEVIRSGSDVTNRSNMQFIILQPGYNTLKITSTVICSYEVRFEELFF